MIIQSTQMVENDLMDLPIGSTSFQVSSDAFSIAFGGEFSEDMEEHAENPNPVSGKADEEELNGFDIEKLNENDLDEDVMEKMAPMAIIGNDDRQPIFHSNKWPYSAHGQLVAVFPNGAIRISSGTLINKRHVITAGHSVHDKKLGGWAKSLDFYPGRNNNSLPFGKVQVAKKFCVQQWTTHQDVNWDFAVLVLEKNIGKYTGFCGVIGFKDNEHKKLLHQKVNVTGYPMSNGGDQMFTHADIIKATSQHRILYNIDTSKGQSGSGVWGTFLGKNGYLVCGVHTTGHYSGNGATRISEQVLACIANIFSKT